MITTIDFTASNNKCIWSVRSIICPYNKDQLFAVYGFGGKVDGKLSHYFPLNSNPQNPTVKGLHGIVEVYKRSLSVVRLSGLTLFTQIITAASAAAVQSFASSHTYKILLILTDGVINDMKETIDEIVNASNTLLSIIIVGVGISLFSGMGNALIEWDNLFSSISLIDSNSNFVTI